MSLYFMKVNNLTKNKQSAVAKAAYISSDVLYSERDEEYKRYKKRTVEPETFILAPSHAPDWVYGSVMPPVAILNNYLGL